MSKLETAIEIVRNGNGDKKAILAGIQNALGVTRANASVYLFKAIKVIGSDTQPSIEVKTSDSPVVEDSTQYDVTDEDRLAYQESMAERTTAGLSVMSIQEWKEMTENLKAFA